MPYLGKAELKNSNIRRWTSTGFSVPVSTIAHGTLGFVPFNEPSTFITVNGIKQHDTAFSLTASGIEFSSPLDVGDEVEVVCIFDVGVPVTTADNTIGIPQLDVTELGHPNYVLTTDGAGNLSFTAKSEETAASLGLVIGTDVQGYHADLTTLATNGIGIGNNQFIQLNGSAQLPAVSGANLTNLPVGDMGGTMTSSIIPDTDDVYDIGSSANKIRDLYLSSNSLHIGSLTVSESSDRLVLPFCTMAGHIIPDLDNGYDIGSAEYKIRDLYVSDNSLWVGDDHKITTSSGKKKTKKRKTGKTPKKIYDALIGDAPKPFLTETALKNAFKVEIHDPAPDPTLDPGHANFHPPMHHWLHFAITNGMGGAVNPENIFDDDEDFEEEGGGGLVLLATVDASDTADVTIDTIFTATYSKYVIEATDVRVSNSGGQNIIVEREIGSVYGNYNYIQNEHQNGTWSNRTPYITAPLNSSSGQRGASFTMTVYDPANALSVNTGTMFGAAYSGFDSSVPTVINNFLMSFGPAALTGIRFKASGGNMSGVFKIYGVTI
jgi:hypothetical protein